MQAIFIIGEQRSGSNLLRMMLNKHTAIAAPHPPHILQRIHPLLPYFGDIQQEKPFQALVQATCELIARNPIPWDIALDPAYIVQQSKERSLIGVFDAIMTQYAQAQEASTWVCKSMQNVYFASELESFFPQAKYIYLHRDPRDVVVSFQKAIIGEKHPYLITQRWVKLQKACIALQHQMPSDRFYTLSYQNLTNDPQTTLQQLCQFIGVSFETNMLDYHHSAEAHKAASVSTLWENLEKPIIPDNSGKFKKALSPSTIQLIEQLAHPEMRHLAYECLYPINHQALSFTEKELLQIQQTNQAAKAHIKQQFKEDHQRRQYQLAVLEEIKNLIDKK